MKKFIFCLIAILFQVTTNFSLADVIMPGMDPSGHGMRVIEPEPISIFSMLISWLLPLITIIAIIIIIVLIITKIKNTKK